MTKLAVFDFDSTLLDGECIDIVLKKIMSPNEQKYNLEYLFEIRNQGMQGEIDLQRSLEQRIAYFEGLTLSELEQICKNIPWTLNAKETISTLKQKGYLTVCLSGAFRTATRRVISDLDIDAYCCNMLESHNGILTGRISGDLLHHQSKGSKIVMLQQSLGITKQNTIAIGDGANDLSMFDQAHKKIAFCAEQQVVEQANCIIETKDLSEILRFID